MQSLQRPEDKLPGIPEVEVISWNHGSRCNLPGISEVISWVFRKVFSWDVPEVFFCLPRSLWETGSCVLRGRFRCAMVRFFATKCKNPNETLTSWPVNGPKSKNTCHEVLGSLERVFLERSGKCFSWNVP